VRLHAQVYACPDDPQVRLRVIRLLSRLDQDQAGTPLDLSVTYTRGDVTYSYDDVPAGTAREMAAALVGASPKVAFMLWEEDHGTGTVYAYTEKLGMFEGPCDQDGRVRRYADDVLAVITRPGRRRAGDQADVGAVRHAVNMLYGIPWREDRDRHR
jgi:hypothetical protein